jgi:ATP-binding cassette subfamily B protein
LASDNSLLVSKLRKAATQFAQLPRALKLVWDAAPGWSAAWAALLLAQGLLPVATVYLVRDLVNGLVTVFKVRAGLDALRPALVPAALIALVLLLTEILKSITKWLREVQAGIVQDHITALVHRQSVAADLAFYDSPEFFDHLHRAREEAQYRPTLLIESLGSLLQNAVTLIAMAVVILRFGVWAIAVLLVGTIPALYVVLTSAVRQHQWVVRATPEERKARYYDWLLTARDAAAELRLFALGDYFESAYRGLRHKLRREQFGIVRQQSFAEFWAAIFALASSAAAIGWMGWKAIQGLVSPGDLAMFYQAFQQGLGLMNALLSNVGQIYASTLFLGGLFEFLSLQPKVADPASPVSLPESKALEITFRNVSFRYPGTQHDALKDFNLTVPAGSIAAIVGPNGAGKSTLLKLLCRFYDPDAGAVEINGIDLRRISLPQVRRSITVLFQQPVHYNATAKQNIALGNLNLPSQESDQAVMKAAVEAGADAVLRQLPAGYDQLLGRWFADGAELSVGEWQRIALARAFLRQAPILILDEPTSAMDPWAEAEWLSRFRALAKGRTVIMITHRFAAARLADQIHVMADGQILESGTHDQLLALQGHYETGLNG